MGVNLAEQPRGSSPRFCQSVLLQTFVGPDEKHFKTVELTVQTTTAEHMAYLFIYCYLLTENGFVSTLFKWRRGWKHIGARVPGVKKLLLAPCSGRSYFSSRERKKEAY